MYIHRYEFKIYFVHAVMMCRGVRSSKRCNILRMYVVDNILSPCEESMNESMFLRLRLRAPHEHRPSPCLTKASHQNIQ